MKETKPTVKILFICHGNICRSPMAEFIMKDLVKKARKEERFEIASAATSTEELGNPVDRRAARELARHGVRCENRRARQVTRRDYTDYDLLICMEQVNVRNVLRMLGGDPQNKIHLLLSYTGSGADIDDPWYTGRFSEVYDQIEAGCKALMEKILTEL